MQAKLTGIKGAVSGLPKRQEPTPAPEPQTDENGKKEVRQTLYLPFGVHDQLREAAFAKRKKMQEIVREAMDLWFAQEGLPSWDEAKIKGERK